MKNTTTNKKWRYVVISAIIALIATVLYTLKDDIQIHIYGKMMINRIVDMGHTSFDGYTYDGRAERGGEEYTLGFEKDNQYIIVNSECSLSCTVQHIAQWTNNGRKIVFSEKGSDPEEFTLLLKNHRKDYPLKKH